MKHHHDRKVPFNCYLSVEQLDALDRVSEEEGKPKAELVREAVAVYLTGRDNDLTEVQKTGHSIGRHNGAPKSTDKDRAVP